MSALVAEALRALRQVDARTATPRARRAVERARALLTEDLERTMRARSAAEDAAVSTAVAGYPVAEVRRWARERGLPVPTHGRYLPVDVVAAWREAQAG